MTNGPASYLSYSSETTAVMNISSLTLLIYLVSGSDGGSGGCEEGGHIPEVRGGRRGRVLRLDGKVHGAVCLHTRRLPLPLLLLL